METRFLMQIIKNRNPQAYEKMRKLMSSGRNPKEILMGMVSDGKLTREQLEGMKEKAKGFGISVSDREIDELFPKGSSDVKGWF